MKIFRRSYSSSSSSSSASSSSSSTSSVSGSVSVLVSGSVSAGRGSNMAGKRNRNHYHNHHHSVLLAALSVTFLFGYLDMHVSASGTVPVADTPSTPEPDPAPGCRAPEIRYIKPKVVEPTTEASYVDFETTQIYLPEDFTTSDIDSIEHINIDLSNSHTDSAINPYQIDMDGGGGGIGNAAALHDDENEDENGTEDPLARRQRLRMERKMGKKRRAGGRRRRLENENGQSRGTGSGRGSRYKRHAIHKDDSPAAEHDKWSGAKLAAEGEVYYVHLDDLLNSKSLNKELRQKLHKMKQKHLKEHSNKCSSGDKKNTDTSCKTKPSYKNGKNVNKNKQQSPAVAGDVVVDGNEPIPKQAPNHSTDNGPPKRHHRTKRSTWSLGEAGGKKNDPKEVLSQRRQQHRDNNNNNNNDIETTNIDNNAKDDGYFDGGSLSSSSSSSSQLSAQDGGNTILQVATTGTGLRHDNGTESESADGSEAGIADNLQRVKRKSGKTTGALSRPKGGGDSGSKTTSRKDKGAFEEEGGYSPVHPDEEESEEEEVEEADSDEQVHFTEVSEIRFPGEIGPLGDRRLCKIRCIKGKWVGPLCATNEEDEHGHIKFQPLYKSCHVNRIPPHLLLSYRNISVNVGWDLPHGHSLQARCKDLGLYKLLGESRVLCSNGLWAPRMPSCVPTTLLTNFSDDSAPSIRIKIGSGSGAFEPSGVLAVLPSSTIHMDCMYPRARGTPEWTWTSWYMQYNTGWSTVHEEKSTKYRLTIKDIQSSDSGTFTCTSPRGLTNSISIIVATSTCPQLTEPAAPLSLRLEGNKLGQRALYRCPQGYRVEGTVNSTCLASGNWSTPPPTCQAVQCPRLILEDSHLSLVELNTSAWGRAVFKCQWGFKLNGPPGLECEPSGVWSGPVPRCRAIQCPAPLVPLNGRIGGTSGSSSHRRYAVGALVTFSCNEGHLLVGEASIVCTETGFWSHPPPFCKSQCPYPGDPPNGLIAPLKFNYDSGDLLSVQCRPGFVEYSPAGPPERPKCLPDGNWSGPVPQCRSYEDV